MKRNLQLFLQFVRVNWMGEMEFRFNLLIWSVINVFWSASFILMINLIYANVNSIAGWDKTQATVLVIIQNIFVGIIWFFVIPSLRDLSHKIRKGELDFMLTKPVDASFVLSVHKQEFDSYVRVVTLIVALCLYLARNSFSISPLSIVAFAVAFVSGLVIIYSLFFLLTTTNFWFIGIFNFDHLFMNAMDIATFPSQMFSGATNLIFVYLIPTLFIATLPTQILLGQISPVAALIPVAVAVVFYYLSQKFWNFALRHYSSASS